MRAAVLCLSILACGISACNRPPPPAAAAGYQCGDIALSATFPEADTATLQLQGRTLTLRRVPAASGAKYADDAGNEFWTKEGAMLTLAGEPMRQCLHSQ